MFHIRRVFAIALIAVCYQPTVSMAADDTQIAQGKEIFNEICVRCHTTEKEGKLGPGLRDVSSRHSAAWINTWLKSPEALIQSGDSAANKLRKENKYGITMPTLPIMQNDKKRKAIIAYLMTL
jgi:cytochrome c2